MLMEKAYASWRGIQEEKYAGILPKLAPHIKGCKSLVDVGIGPGWFEDFLEQRGFRFDKILGVEKDFPREEWKNFYGRFDLLACIDALHLLENPKEILMFLRPKGIALISLPEKFKERLDLFQKEEILEQGVAGGKEKDYFIILRKPRPGSGRSPAPRGG